MNDDASALILKKLDDIGQDVKILRSDVKSTKSDVTMLTLRMHTFDDRVKAMQVDISDLNEKVGKLSTSVHRLEILQEETDTKITRLAEDVGGFMDKTTDSESKIESHDDTLQFHDRRIAFLEKKAA